MKEIPICTMNYISGPDIEEAMGCDRDDFVFIDYYEDSACAFLDLDDEKVKELEEEIAWYENKFVERYVQRCKNELKLVNYLRSKGFNDRMCIIF